MPPETCQEHLSMVEERAKTNSDIAIIKNDIMYIRNKICKHVEEGEKEGGFRDRLLLLERSVSELKKALWGRVFVAGLVGGLVGGKLTPEIINFLMKVLIK